MFNICVPIDDYIDKTFFIKKEELIILPRKKEENTKTINLTMNLNDDPSFKNIDGDILSALTDGFVNGYIESHKDIIKELLKLNYSYNDICNITKLSQESIEKIESGI